MNTYIQDPNLKDEKPPVYSAYSQSASAPPTSSAQQVNEQNNVSRWNDVESQQQSAGGAVGGPNDQWGNFGTGLTDKVVRIRFIRKVYLIVTCQLVFTFGIVLIFTAVDAIRNWMTKTTGGLVLYILA